MVGQIVGQAPRPHQGTAGPGYEAVGGEKRVVAAYWAGAMCMELPEDQRRTLSEIEEHLAQESPRLAEEFDHHRVSMAPRGLAAVLMALPLGLFAATLGTASGWTVLVVGGLGLTVVVPTLIIG